jgi:Flp pilus assembly protein TadG
MSPGSSSQRRPRLGHAGTATLEFALVAIPFVFILLAGMDLGRYFITQHSLRTLVSEAARATLVYCYGATGSCSLTPSTGTVNWQTVEAKVPFLQSASLTPTPTANQSAPDPNTGVRTISVTVNYPFTFLLPAWIGLNAGLSPITEKTSLKY